MLIGVFGGTFDPVHLGHLIAAEQCREQARLDKVLFVPAARPPHKPHRTITPFSHRVEMLTLAVAGHPIFQVAELERDRPGPSYTVDTLEELRQRYPGAGLMLILGSDCLPDLAGWRDPARIGQQADLLVVPRTGSQVKEPPPAPEWPTGLKVGRAIEMPLVAISSHDIRRRVAEQRSVRYLVPRAVECYIDAHGLYRAV
jgi:nicotinate-nucleotide adenylyltransferase